MRIERLLVFTQRAAGAGLAIAIGAFCTSSLWSAPSWFAPTQSVKALDRADDPLHGLAILETVRKPAAAARARAADPDAVILLDEWTFTSKGKPSPYQ
jgi:hypothetical protein